MLYRRSPLFVVAATILALGCGDKDPTSPSLSAVGSEAVDSKAGRGRPGASLTGVVDQALPGAAIEGVVRITKLEQGPPGQLLASGVISGTANGQAFTQTFTSLPATLSGGSAAATAAAGPGIQQVGSCDILFLDLGPLNLDILGLTVDLSQIVLDINAVAGAGNLLGNLLCAVVGLLDGFSLGPALANILDLVNSILGALLG